MHRNSAVAESDRQLEIPGIAQLLVGNGSLSKVRVTTAGAVGEIYMHGAQVTSWKPAGREEVFFVSSRSPWEDGRPIRGGVPISFPWFASKVDDPTAPAHGFVRTKAWQLESISQEGSAVTVSMSTESNEDTKRWSPAEFRLFYRVSFGSELYLELDVANTGETPLRFEEALHAYYRVGNIEETRVRGLNAVLYLDKTDSNREKTQQGEMAVISETDRVYLNTSHAIEIDDPVLRRRIQVSKENSLTTVVWNPWREKARSMSDLGADEWMQMICVETSNVPHYSVVLAPGQQHTMKSVVRVEDFQV
jgi:glucose-6-phosphate 1-epimerase